MGAIDDHDATSLQARDDGDLPEWPSHVEWPRENPHYELAKRCSVARRGEDFPSQVSAEVEIGIVDPNRVGQVQRHAVDTLAVTRDQMYSLLDRLLDTYRATAAGNLRFTFEHVDSAEVERGLWPLRVQEPRVTPGKRLVEGLYVHFIDCIQDLWNSQMAWAAGLRRAAILF